MKKTCHYIAVFAAVCTLSLCVFNSQSQPKAPRTLLIFFDGLRPDYITPQTMPNLYAFRQQGAYGRQHHSVFPTVTRVNASAYATGSYPAKSGLMGNTVYFPEVDKLKGLNTAEAADLVRIEKATDGRLLTAVSLGELLQKAGQKMMVFSSGSTGQAMLQNHKISGGAVVNPDMILPESFKDEVIKTVGPIPPKVKPGTARHQWVADALIKLGLRPGGPMVNAIWFSDPDDTAHEDGIGAETSMASIKVVDAQFGRIIDYLKSSGQYKQFNIIISADHGFISHSGGGQNVRSLLINKGLMKDSTDDVVMVEGAIYVKNHDPEVIKKIVATLQEQPNAGPVFTRSAHPGDLKGWIDGTLSFEAIHWNNPTRSGDILTTANWNDNKNKFGYAGMSQSGGVAGHGGISPYEVHIALIASGPAFKKNFVSDLPTSNIDIVPTILHLEHLPIPQQMDGRVVYELLKEKAPPSFPAKAHVDSLITRNAASDYQLLLHRTILGDHVYIDFGKASHYIK